jgi:ribosomal protein S18 acetylase RimI-like enzyme
MSPSGPSIVEAHPRQWCEFRALRLDALRREPSAYASTYDEALARPEAFWRERLADEGTMNLVAIVEDEMVGMVGAYVAAPDDPSVAVVVGLYVAAEYRRCGLGRQLLETVLDRLAERTEIVTIRLSVNPNQVAACALYQSVGFERTRHPDSDDAAADAWCMERPARPL